MARTGGRTSIGDDVKTLVLANQKGGVGKSAVVTQFAFHLAHRGLRVLVVDLDHQKNATTPLTKSGLVKLASFTASALLAGEGVNLPEGAFVLVAGDAALSGLERQPERHNGFVAALQAFLESAADRFDVCVVDTNPNPDIRYAAALITADFLLSPIELNQEAIDGIASLLAHPRYGFHKIRQIMNPRLILIGILPNLVEATQFQRENLAQLVASYAQLLIAMPGDGGQRYAFIATRTAVAEAQAAGVPLWALRGAAVSVQSEATAARGTAPAPPVRSAARDAWREVRPVFEEIARRMGLGGSHGT